MTFKECFNELTLKSILSRERGGFPPQNIFSKTYTFYLTNPCGNYLLDGRCEISNNAAERRAKSYATARKNFLFHDTVDGANASAIVMSLIETAKANNLNIYQYLYTLLLYMPDYKNEPAGIKQLMPWSEFIKENCSGITDTEKILPENRGDLPI